MNDEEFSIFDDSDDFFMDEAGTGIFCQLWSDCADCEEECSTCGHCCSKHSHGEGCNESGCSCEKWED